MSQDQTVYEERVAKLEHQLLALHETRESMFARIREALAEANVYARSMNGHLYAFDAKPARALLASLDDLCTLHEGVLSAHREAVAARDAAMRRLPVESQAAIAGLRLLPKGIA